MKDANVIHKNLTNFSFQPNLADYASFSTRFSWDSQEHLLDFFPDGTLNIAYNAIDRYAQTDKIAFHFVGADGGRETFSYSRMRTLTNQFANVLVHHDIQKGDRIFLFLPTIPERYVAFLGALKVGAVVGTLFSAFQDMALLDRLKDSGARMVVTDATLFSRIERIWKELPHLETVLVVERGSLEQPKGDHIFHYSSEMRDALDTFDVAHMKRDEYAYMLYTSGTTGKPKGVVHSHFDILQAMVTTKYVLDLQEGDIYWCTADLGWVTGVVYGVLGPMGLGITSVFYEGRFSPENWYTILQDMKVSVWYTAPTAIRMLMGSSLDVKQFDLSHLRHLSSVGEPLNPEAVWWALEKFGLPFHDTWWQTELGGISITNFPSMDIKPGSMGKPFPGIIAAIIDDEGHELDSGKEGNLVLKKDTVSSLMKTIWKNEQKFQSYFQNNWYLSGDRAYRDEDGYFWFVGRADDVINTSGERVGPFEVESALVTYPDVIEAGVIGKPDTVRGEIIKAFVVLKPNVHGNADLEEKLKEHVKKHLAGHSYPREIEFVGNLPKTRSGKIMRRLLKARELGLPLGDTSTLEDY